ncbi:MAG: hypothetical protein M0Z51_14555 [Propionibacterium sp.]|nr:hypothetical protein [Propionibacterium sp.]
MITVLHTANDLTTDEREAEMRRLQEHLSQVEQDLDRQLAIVGELRNRMDRLEYIGGLRAVRPTDVVVELGIAA